MFTFKTSAGEQTVVATVPFNIKYQHPHIHHLGEGGARKGETHRCKTRREMTNDIVLEILRLQ